VYKGNQKKKKAQNPDLKESKRKSDLENLLENFLGVKEEEIVYEDRIINKPKKNVVDEVEEFKTNVTEKPFEVFSYDKAYEQGNYFEKKEVYTSETLRKGRSKTVKGSKPVHKKKKPRFDVRKAIIYSEILRRPSY
jgi:hypothetical protein